MTSVAKEQGWRTYNVSVDAPEGFDVTVTPSTFRLKPGMTASYEVTVSNVSAPVGEWRHGSLTWSDTTGNYTRVQPDLRQLGARRFPRRHRGEWGRRLDQLRRQLRVHRRLQRRGARPGARDRHLRHRGAGPGSDLRSERRVLERLHVRDVGVRHSSGWRSRPRRSPIPTIDLDIFLFDPAGDLVAIEHERRHGRADRHRAARPTAPGRSGCTVGRRPDRRRTSTSTPGSSRRHPVAT